MVTLFCAALSVVFAADPTAHGAATAQALHTKIAAGDWAGAASLVRELERVVARQAPLEIVDIQVLGSPPEGLGMYTELFKGLVRSENMYIYAQVRNHGLREAAGFHTLDLVSDLIIMDSQGTELARDEGFGRSTFNARTPHRDTFVVIALRARGLSPGRYQAKLVIRDKIGGKTASGKVRFRIP